MSAYNLNVKIFYIVIVLCLFSKARPTESVGSSEPEMVKDVQCVPKKRSASTSKSFACML